MTLCRWALLLATILPWTLAPASEAGDWYLGLGQGYSKLEPYTGNSIYTIDDGEDGGIKLLAGRHFSQRITAEAEYADLGTVTLAPTGSISYKVYSLSGAYYLLDGTNPLFPGWHLFGRAGLAYIDNSADIRFQKEHAASLHFGFGVEVDITDHWGVRLDSTTYDDDAAMTALSLLYRLNGRAGGSTAAPAPRPAPASAPADSDRDGVADDRDQCPDTPAGSAVDNLGCARVSDDDGDGIPNNQDQCPQSPPGILINSRGCDADPDRDGLAEPQDQCAGSPQGIVVDDNGCATFQVMIKALHFAPRSASLDKVARAILDKVAEELQIFPHVRLEIQAHTDASGDNKADMELSQRRAEAILVYLMNRRVDLTRLRTRGFGSSRPATHSDGTPAPARNNRVELVEMAP